MEENNLDKYLNPEKIILLQQLCWQQASLLLTKNEIQTSSGNSHLISLFKLWIFLYLVWIIKMKGIFFLSSYIEKYRL